jgi:hypothetical protein
MNHAQLKFDSSMLKVESLMVNATKQTQDPQEKVTPVKNEVIDIPNTPYHPSPKALNIPSYKPELV